MTPEASLVHTVVTLELHTSCPEVDIQKLPEHSKSLYWKKFSLDPADDISNVEN